MGFDYTRRGVAEFIGTFALIFIGATASIYNDQTVAALGNGLVIAVMVSAFAGISGGHFNPAVTMGFFVTRRIAVPLAIFYWVVQFGAAALAALLLRWILPSQVKAAHYGAPTVNSVIDPGKAVFTSAGCRVPGRGGMLGCRLGGLLLLPEVEDCAQHREEEHEAQRDVPAQPLLSGEVRVEAREDERGEEREDDEDRAGDRETDLVGGRKGEDHLGGS